MGAELFGSSRGTVFIHGGFNARGKRRSGRTAQCFTAMVQLAAVLCGVVADSSADFADSVAAKGCGSPGRVSNFWQNTVGPRRKHCLCGKRAIEEYLQRNEHNFNSQ